MSRIIRCASGSRAPATALVCLGVVINLLPLNLNSETKVYRFNLICQEKTGNSLDGRVTSYPTGEDLSAGGELREQEEMTQLWLQGL